MLVEAVKRLLGLKKKTGIKLIVSCEKLEKRVALLENNRLEEYTIERETDRNIVGSIYKGKVRNIEPGIKAMFVDIGFEKNAFLQFWDAIPAALDSGIETINREGGNKKKAPRITHKDVPNIYPVGSDVLVQVKKGPISNKGPRITTDISLAGRYLVLMPFNDQFGISRKIEDPKERDRLRTILRELDVPEGMGIIMRTVGAGQRARYFVRDLSLLLEQWAQVQSGMDQKQAPACLFEEPDLVERTVRDFLTDEVDAIIVDDAKSVERMQEIVGHISKRAKKSIQHYTGAQPIFECFGVKAQIEAAFHRQVWLPCGGYIVIDETEAMIAVDVNTGRNKGAKDMEKTILQTNLEAAEEIARLTARALLEIGAVHFNAATPFTLASGLPSPTYIDCRKLISYPRIRSVLMDFLCVTVMRDVGFEAFDNIAGGETAGIPFAALVAERLALPMT